MVIIIILALCVWMIDIARPLLFSHRYWIHLCTASIHVCVLDAVKVKSRMYMIAIGIIFVLLNIYELYYRIFTDWDQGILLFKYTIQEDKYASMKRSTKRNNIHTNYVVSVNGILPYSKTGNKN